MLTDEYLTRLFIKHGDARRSGAGEGESLSASTERTAGPGGTPPRGAGWRRVHAQVGRLTTLGALKMFTQCQRVTNSYSSIQCLSDGTLLKDMGSRC